MTASPGGRGAGLWFPPTHNPSRQRVRLASLQALEQVYRITTGLTR